MSNLSCCFGIPSSIPDLYRMAIDAKRLHHENKRGLWVDQEVLAKHLQTRPVRSPKLDDKHPHFNNRILKLADIALAEKGRADCK